MDKLVIQGGKPLSGTVSVSGSKNAALPIIAASMMATGEHTIFGVPHLRDIRTMIKLLEYIGAEVEWNDKLMGTSENRPSALLPANSQSSRTPPVRSGCSFAGRLASGQFLEVPEKEVFRNVLTIHTNKFNATEAPYDLVKTMRASILVLGPLVGQLRRARISLPGGCAIGARPIDLHLKALEAMGAKIDLSEGYVEVFARHLHGAEITFDKVTVTGTENIMMAAALADGETILANSAREPEVVDLANHLNAMGAKIEGAGTDRIVIHGVDKLKPAAHTIIPDRIEAGTLLIAAGITGGELNIRNFPVAMLKTLIGRLREAGMTIVPDGNVVLARGAGRPKSVNITTAPHPGFATDLQAQFMAFMAVSGDTSIITETIFENRFMHVPELLRMGADITLDGKMAVVKGVEKLKGAPVMATDLRASASLVLAGLAAEGTTEVRRIYHLDRGYERIEEKLSACGANIMRAPGEDT